MQTQKRKKFRIWRSWSGRISSNGKSDPKLYIGIMLYEKEDLKPKPIRRGKEDHYILIDTTIFMNKK